MDETISSLHNMSMNVESEEESGLNGVHNTRNKKRSREITSKKIVPEKGKKTFKQKLKLITNMIFFYNTKESEKDDRNKVTPKPTRREFNFKRKDNLPSHAHRSPSRTSENVVSENGKKILNNN